MAIRFYVLIFAALLNCAESQNTSSTENFQGDSFEETSRLQTNDDNISVSTSTTMTYNVTFDEKTETGYTSSAATNLLTTPESSSDSEEWTTLEEETTISFRHQLSSLQPDSSTLSSETNAIDFGTNNDNTTAVYESTSDQGESTEGREHLSLDVSNFTASSEKLINTYSLNDSGDCKSNSSSKVQEDILILLRSNCSIVNRENVPLNEAFAEVGCTIYLRINLSLENGTRDKLISNLQKLTIKPSDFQIVKLHNQAEDASEQKQQRHYNFPLEPATLAYLAVASSFAFVLLLLILIVGFCCFKRRRPSLDVSPFDVRLSSYTLTKIPRASLTPVDCSRESDCLDDKSESPDVRSRNCGSCESGLDTIPCDSFSSNREMKTFGVSVSARSRSTDSPSDMYPQHSAIAYENHTFQRYF